MGAAARKMRRSIRAASTGPVCASSRAVSLSPDHMARAIERLVVSSSGVGAAVELRRNFDAAEGGVQPAPMPVEEAATVKENSSRRGGRARLKASDSKSDRGVSPSGVQILSPPPNSRSAPSWMWSYGVEGWPSGRRCGTGNAVYGQLYRGFESHPLRQFCSRWQFRFRWAVLDGEVAVPCNPQSATAGSNSPLRAARVE
jgi:hypothetical protein